MTVSPHMPLTLIGDCETINDMLKRWLYAVLVCLLAVPVAIYLLGGLIVGPYEGERGLIGLMSTIYVDALTGHASTWVMLLAPVLIVAIWLGCIKLRRSVPR